MIFYFQLSSKGLDKISPEGKENFLYIVISAQRISVLVCLSSVEQFGKFFDQEIIPPEGRIIPIQQKNLIRTIPPNKNTVEFLAPDKFNDKHRIMNQISRSSGKKTAMRMIYYRRELLFFSSNENDRI